MSDAQRAVMESPYHPRMNRTYVNERGEAVDAAARESFKVEFDEKVRRKKKGERRTEKREKRKRKGDDPDRGTWTWYLIREVR